MVHRKWPSLRPLCISLLWWDHKCSPGGYLSPSRLYFSECSALPDSFVVNTGKILTNCTKALLHVLPDHSEYACPVQFHLAVCLLCVLLMFTKNVLDFPPLSECTFQGQKVIIFLLMLLHKWQMKTPQTSASYNTGKCPGLKKNLHVCTCVTGLCGPTVCSVALHTLTIQSSFQGYKMFLEKPTHLYLTFISPHATNSFSLNSFTFSICFSFLSHLCWLLQVAFSGIRCQNRVWGVRYLFVINTCGRLREHWTVRKTQGSCINSTGIYELLSIRVVPNAWTQPGLHAPASLSLTVGLHWKSWTWWGRSWGS